MMYEFSFCDFIFVRGEEESGKGTDISIRQENREEQPGM